MYGARPLKRTIQRRLLDPLALRVLQGDFWKATRIRVDARGGELTFRKAQKPCRAQSVTRMKALVATSDERKRIGTPRCADAATAGRARRSSRAA